MGRLTIVAVIVLNLLFQGISQAASRDIELPDDFTQSQLEDLSRQFGMAISYTPLAPAEPLGILGLDVGLEVTLVDIDQDESFWTNAIEDNPPSYLAFPKLHVQKGLPLGFDIGLQYAKVPGSNIGLWGGELKWAFVKGGIAFPAIALRGSYTQLIGVDDLDLTTYGADLSISKGFTFLTPYAGIGQIWIQTKEKTDLLDLDTEDQSLTKGFVGIKLTLFVFSFVAEADFGEIPIYSLRANLSL
jgi:hypothetical protein